MPSSITPTLRISLTSLILLLLLTSLLPQPTIFTHAQSQSQFQSQQPPQTQPQPRGETQRSKSKSPTIYIEQEYNTNYDYSACITTCTALYPSRLNPSTDPSTSTSISTSSITSSSSTPCTDVDPGRLLDLCICSQYLANLDPQINCIQKCPWEEQQRFAQDLPALCGRTLFPYFDLQKTPWPPRENSLPAVGMPEDMKSESKSPSSSSTTSASSTVSTASPLPNRADSMRKTSVITAGAGAGDLGYLVAFVALAGLMYT